MITDKLNMFSEDQADWYDAGSYPSAKSIDLGLSAGLVARDLPFFYVKTGAAAAATGTSVECKLICADDAALTSNVTVLATSGAILTAALTANKIIWSGKLPEKITKRYLGMQYVSVESSDFTAGALTAGLAAELPLQK